MLNGTNRLGRLNQSSTMKDADFAIERKGDLAVCDDEQVDTMRVAKSVVLDKLKTGGLQLSIATGNELSTDIAIDAGMRRSSNV